MIIIIRALSRGGKDDGYYDSPTSRDETSDFTKRKEKRQRKAKKRPKKEKNERKREKGQCYYPFTTLVLQSSTMFLIKRVS